jgi:hypothetical protein
VLPRHEVRGVQLRPHGQHSVGRDAELTNLALWPLKNISLLHGVSQFNVSLLKLMARG